MDHARRRGHVAMVDEAIDRLDDPDLARAILLDLRSRMAEGLNWSPVGTHKKFVPPSDDSNRAGGDE